MSIINVENAHASTKLLAATTLRNVLGTKVLSEILSDRESIAHTMQVSLFDYGHVTLSVYFDLFRARWLRPCHVDFANITCLNYGSLYVSVSFAVNVVAWFDTLSHDLILCHMVWCFDKWNEALCGMILSKYPSWMFQTYVELQEHTQVQLKCVPLQ